MRDPFLIDECLFLIDECLSPDLVALANSRGFDACNCRSSILCPLTSFAGLRRHNGGRSNPAVSQRVLDKIEAMLDLVN
jgi:hypothetical protein